MTIAALRTRWPRLDLLVDLARPHSAKLALGFVLGLVATGIALAGPMATKWVLDSLADSTSMTRPLVVLAVLLVFGSLITLWQWVLLGRVAERIVLDARESLVRRFFRARVGEVSSRPTGELVTRVTSDTVLLREAATSSAIELLNGLIGLVGTLVLMAVLDPVLLGAIVVAILVVAALFATLMPAIANAEQRTQEAIGRLGGTLEGSLGAIRTIKASRAEQRIGDSVVEDARTAARHAVESVWRQALAWTVSWGGVNLAIIAVLALGAWRVSSGQLAVSSLIAFLLYAFQLMGPVTQLSQNVTALQSGIAAAARIQEVRDMPVEEDEPHLVGDPTPVPAATAFPAGWSDSKAAGPLVSLRGVSLTYPSADEAALRDVDLDIARRGHTALVGPSGAGKTSLLSLLLRFVEPDEGSLLLDGAPYTDLGYARVRSRMAYVEQDTPVVPGTVRSNLLVADPGASDDDLLEVLRAVRLDEMVEKLEDGLATSLQSSSVSGGQRQRIALARALLRRPDLLLLDEATSQVDSLTEVAIHTAIAERSTSGAVVTVAHRLSTVIDADHIIVLDDGRVRDQGTHTELLGRDELYRALVEALRIGIPLRTPAPATV